MKTMQFKLYAHKRNRHLHRTINAAGWVWNHCIALHKRYYRRWGKHLSCARLQKHIAKLRRRNPVWQQVGSQAVQDVCQRIERGYQLFFKHHQRGVRPPSFRKVRKYKSFTLKQAGYKFLDGNRIRIGGRVYCYWKSRAIEGQVKTVTVKRNALGELFLFVTVQGEPNPIPTAEPSRIAGFDFGLKRFLSCSEGAEHDVDSPLFLKQSLSEIRRASGQLSRKQKGSGGRRRARLNLARRHDDVANRRADWFWKLAHRLTDEFDVLCFETLNLKGMQRLWGRKVGDLGFASFLQILEWVAQKKGKQVVFIDPWYPSSKTCHGCGHVLKSLTLDVRRWRCPSCGGENDRDRNAAMNIKKVGVSTFGLGEVRQALPALSV
ncbi:MAG: transposase [Cyanobacteria bacterium J06642_2]